MRASARAGAGWQPIAPAVQRRCVFDEQQAAIEAEEKRREAERAEELAGMSLRKLFSDASDDELRREGLRCSREFSNPVRVWSIGQEEARRRLAQGLMRLNAAKAEAYARVKKEIVEQNEGPSVGALIQSYLAWDAAAQAGAWKAQLEDLIEPDGDQITEIDHRAERAKTRRELDNRRTEIGNELARRQLQLAGALPGVKRTAA